MSWLKQANDDDDVPGMNIDQSIGEEDEFPEDDQPQDDDINIEDRGGYIAAYQGGKEIARAKNRDFLDLMLHKHMEKSGWFPNVWQDGGMSTPTPADHIRQDFIKYEIPKIKDEIIAGLEYYGPEPVYYSDLYDNAIRRSDFRFMEDEFKPLIDEAFKQLESDGQIKETQKDMFIVVPKPSAPTDFDPQSLPQLDPRQKQKTLDKLLDQYNSTSDPNQKQQIEQRMKSLGWLKQ